MTVNTSWKFVIAGLVMAHLVAACGQAEVAAPTATERPAEPVPPTATEAVQETEPTAAQDAEAEPTDTQEQEPTVMLGQTALGEVLVDAQGLTLYAFTEDSADSSTCGAGCVEFWPPLTVEAEPVAGEGVDQGLLGTITRDDGSRQVTFAGRPVYTYSEDAAPGDVDGQGFSNTWYVLGVDGDLIQQAGGDGGDGGDDLDDLY